jgi:hypothetical protein
MSVYVISVVFDMDHETKNTVVYREQRPEVGERAIGTLYLRKEFFDALGKPENIRVRVQAEMPAENG